MPSVSLINMAVIVMVICVRLIFEPYVLPFVLPAAIVMTLEGNGAVAILEYLCIAIGAGGYLEVSPKGCRSF